VTTHSTFSRKTVNLKNGFLETIYLTRPK
jgi:hypothetical protein